MPRRSGSNNEMLLSDEQKLNNLIEAYKNGMSWEEMERQFGVSHGTCYNALENAGALKKGKRRNILKNTKRVKEILQAYKSGLTLEEIAEKFSMSVGAVRKALNAPKIKKRNATKNRSVKKFQSEKALKELIGTYYSGMTWVEMEKKYKVSRGTISKVLKSAGIPNRSGHKTEAYDSELVKEVENAYKSKKTIEQVSRDLNISVWKVRKILNIANVEMRKPGKLK